MKFIFPYRDGSKSVSALRDALQAMVIRREASRFRGNPKKTVINWGASSLPEEVLKSRVLNKVDCVRVAGNKLETFKALQAGGVKIPTYCTEPRAAMSWLEKDMVVVARKVLTSHSGNGIEILEKGLDFVEAPCYTQYIPKQAEYRVHVFKTPSGGYEVVDVQRKVKDPEREIKDWKVRSHSNGFMFIRLSETGQTYKEVCEESIKTEAIKAVSVLGLDFGAVDIVVNKKRGVFVLEVNTACGLEGTSVQIYTEALRKLI